MLVLTWEWLGYVFGLYPYTRPWSEASTHFLVRTVVDILEAIARGLPSLFVAILILTIAWIVDRTLRRFFDRVTSSRIAFGWLDLDTARRRDASRRSRLGVRRRDGLSVHPGVGYRRVQRD